MNLDIGDFMDNYEWQQYLRMIALRCQITQLEEEVFLLIDKNFTKRILRIKKDKQDTN